MKLIEPKELIATPPKDENYEREADRWLEIFSIFIHDIESPLASMKYVLRLLSEGRLDTDNERHQRLVRSSHIALDRAESILYDIMAVAKAGKIGIPLQLTDLLPGTVVQEAVAMSEPSAQEHGITIACSDDSGEVAVIADPKLLRRTLDNLIYNAIRHTPVGGTMHVYTETGETGFFIHVKDSGEGLGDIEPEQLFEKYGQIQLRAEGKHRGVGLGLYFCKLAATGMGGTIFADDHPDGGAVFTIRLKKAGA